MYKNVELPNLLLCTAKRTTTTTAAAETRENGRKKRSTRKLTFGTLGKIALISTQKHIQVYCAIRQRRRRQRAAAVETVVGKIIIQCKKYRVTTKQT